MLYPSLNSCRIAVMGLGYVGLPLAMEFSRVKKSQISDELLDRKIVGFDIDKKRIEDLKNNIDTTKEFAEDELKLSKNIIYSSSIEDLENCEVFIISVPTPITEAKIPDLDNIKKACKLVGNVLTNKVLKQDFLSNKISPVVIFESTVYPGMTEEICIPLIKKCLEEIPNNVATNLKFGYSPERINPGDKKNKLTNIIKVTSGCDTDTAKWIDKLYASIIEAGTKLAPSIKVAEAAKVIENTQRDLNIALINELSIILDKLNIDTLDVLEVASTKWNFINFKPGLVGGHCIGVDPYYLTYKSLNAGYYPEVVLAGRRINDNMPQWIVEKIIKELFKKSFQPSIDECLLLGFTFKENCSDIRNTKVIDLIKNLEEYKISSLIVDPHANKESVEKIYGFKINNQIKFDKKFKLIILAVAHEEFLSLEINDWLSLGYEDCLFVDIKGKLPRILNPIRI